MKKTMMAVALLLGLMQSTPAMAADFELEIVFEDTLYGAAIGALVGGGAMLLTPKPTDNWDYISKGTGIGIIIGALYGVATTTGALASYEDGKLRVAMPTPRLFLQDSFNNGAEVAWQMDMFNTRF